MNDTNGSAALPPSQAQDPNGFISCISVPAGWHARFRNMRVWQVPEHGDNWFIEPMEANDEEAQWTVPVNVGGPSGADVYHRGPIRFLHVHGGADIERRPQSWPERHQTTEKRGVGASRRKILDDGSYEVLTEW